VIPWEPFEELGNHLGNVWPIVIAAIAIYGAFHKATTRLAHALTVMIDEKLAPIRTEVTPNGGGSMKDAQKRMEDNQVQIQSSVESIGRVLEQVISVTAVNQGRLQAVIATIPLAYYEMDAYGNVVSVNEAYLKLFDITEDEALHSMEWRKHIPPEDLVLIDRSGALSMSSQRDWYLSLIHI
jgi:PAS domain-containing protein